jgi:acetyltransferase-like isoleucine patch superfamily enzyme
MTFEAHYIDVIIRQRLKPLLSSLIAKIKAKWWGVKIGKRLFVNGKIKFRRLPKSKIIIGDGCRFNSSFDSNLIGVNHPCIISTLKREAEINIGFNCAFSGTTIGAFKKITIESGVKCGANTLITDSDWHEEDSRSSETKEVYIGKNVWLGVNAIVLKGVSIGENSLIGANSVVTTDIPANVIAAGNPCKVLKEIVKTDIE